MNPLQPSRRRAEAFDAAVEAARHGDVGSDPLVGLVGVLREAGGAEAAGAARPAFVADLRERLLLAAETELVPAGPRPAAAPSIAAPISRATRTRHERRLAVAVGGFAIVAASGSMAVAAQSALPGEVLYPVKRALEDAGTGLAPDDRRGEGLLAHATSRLDELDDLGATTDPARVDAATESVMVDTLVTFSDQADRASDDLITRFDATGDPEAVTALKQFTTSSLERLVTLESVLPDAVRPAVLDAAQVLFVIDQAANEACAECPGGGITELPSVLTSATGLDLTATLEALPTPAPTTGEQGREKTRPEQPAATPRAETTPPVAPPPSPTPTLPAVPPAPTPSAQLPAVPKVSTGTTTKKGGQVLEDVGTLLSGVTEGLTGPAPTAAPTNLGEVLGGVVGGTLDTVDGLTGNLLGGQQP